MWAHLVVPRAVGRLYFGGSAASWLAAWWEGGPNGSSGSGSGSVSVSSSVSNRTNSSSDDDDKGAKGFAFASRGNRTTTRGGGDDREADYFSTTTTTLPRSGPRDLTNDGTGGAGIGDGKGKGKDQGKDKDGSSSPVPYQNQQQQQPPQPHSGEGGLDARIIAEIETDILDVFSDAYCNKHLMYGALELVLVRLMPELAEKGVTELWEERLS